ncbi:MAG: AI-2E family transporter [Candidatus Nanopelagicales bacterium]|nr:AI-2E family transporter [Candidatus Nanopelagicales bacterium]MDZ4250713.1 AI-2E family transporter [Candidatus Nanopelagicales bacterium]
MAESDLPVAQPDGLPDGAHRIAEPGGPPALAVATVAPLGVPPMLVALSGTLARLMVVAVALAVVLWFVFLIGPVSLALFLALFVTALAGPVARLFARVLPKAVAVVLALVLIAGVSIFILALVVRSIIEQGSALASSVTSGINQVEDWLQHGPLGLTGETLTNLTQSVQQWLTNVGKDMLGGIASSLGTLGTVITAGSVFLFATIFFMTSGESIWRWLLSWVPERARAATDISGQLAWRTLAGYTRGVVVVAIADAALVFIGLLILKVPLAPALAAVVFLGAFIPVIGAPIATLLAAVVALATEGLVTAILVVVLTVVVGSVDGDILQPLVMGRAVNLHPLAIVTIIAGGALTMGVIGALIAVPVVSSIYVIAKYLAGRDPEHPFPPTVAADEGALENVEQSI